MFGREASTSDPISTNMILKIIENGLIARTRIEYVFYVCIYIYIHINYMYIYIYVYIYI